MTLAVSKISFFKKTVTHIKMCSTMWQKNKIHHKFENFKICLVLSFVFTFYCKHTFWYCLSLYMVLSSTFNFLEEISNCLTSCNFLQWVALLFLKIASLTLWEKLRLHMQFTDIAWHFARIRFKWKCLLMFIICYSYANEK